LVPVQDNSGRCCWMLGAPRALWVVCALLAVSAADGQSGRVYAEHHGRRPPPPSTNVLDIKNDIAKKVDENIQNPDEVLPPGIDVRARSTLPRCIRAARLRPG
jgi:hypothetical protein